MIDGSTRRAVPSTVPGPEAPITARSGYSSTPYSRAQFARLVSSGIASR